MLDEEIGIYLEQSMIANETNYNVKEIENLCPKVATFFGKSFVSLEKCCVTKKPCF